MRRVGFTIIMLIVVTAGCGEATTESPVTPTTATPSTILASTTTTATTTPTVDAVCPGCQKPPDLPSARRSGSGWVDATLSPGTYHTRLFELPLSFTTDEPLKTLGESVGWMSFSFQFGQHFVDFWGPTLLEDIDLVAWIQSQADEGEVELLAVEQTTLFGGPATQIDVSITENRYLPFAEEGQRLMGRTRLLVTEIDGRPLLVTFSGLSCASFPMCTADNAEANEFQFLKHISRTERFLSSVSFDR